ncbi:unnamed protein product [Jaminaea pallidilutea]
MSFPEPQPYQSQQQPPYYGSGGPPQGHSTYPGGPGGFNAPGGSSSPYPPHQPAQSASPYPEHASGGYGERQGGGEANSYYGSAPGHHEQQQSSYQQQQYQQPGQQQQQQQQPVQYDEYGNPIEGERGIGTMAMGGLAGFAGNKLMGGGHGSMASMGTGALLAQGGKMAYDMFKKHKNQGGGQSSHHGGGGHYGGHGGHGGQSYGQGPPPSYGGGPPSSYGYGSPAPYGGHSPAGGGRGGGFFGKRDI